jgi:hypothetical protein
MPGICACFIWQWKAVIADMRKRKTEAYNSLENMLRTLIGFDEPAPQLCWLSSEKNVLTALSTQPIQFLFRQPSIK